MSDAAFREIAVEAQRIAREAIGLAEEIEPLYDAIEWLTRPENVRFSMPIRAAIGDDMRYFVDAVRLVRGDAEKGVR